MVSARLFFDRRALIIFVSIVFGLSKSMYVTLFFVPMRWHLSSDWSLVSRSKLFE